MKTIHQKKTTALMGILAVFLFFTFFVSCKKDIHNDIPTVPDHSPDLSTKVNASVAGFVTDENNDAVSGALVKFGPATTITNQFGYFELKNVQVLKEAALVTVEHTGYFKAFKVFATDAGKSGFFRIKLLPKTIAGTIDAGSGGSVFAAGGLIISFPANGIKNASTGNIYSGSVNVAAKWLDPTSSELNMIMPGDLRGINTGGFIKLLSSFGMAAVELTGTGGELLQIADGKKATITMPLPASIATNAPSSIPLWYFDETNGLWKEEGSATKTANTYIGDVSHFSFWNCDIPNNFVQLDCIIEDISGNPIQHATVRITVVNPVNPFFTSGVDYTDFMGHAGGFVPDNAQLILNVYSPYCVGPALYTKNITTTNVNIDLGHITIPSPNYANVSGTVTDCNNAPVHNGILFINNGGQFYAQSITGGSYGFNALLCDANATINLNMIAQDNDAYQQSVAVSYTVVAGTNVITNIQACGAQQVYFISNGYLYHPTAPRTITNYPKTLSLLSTNSVSCGMGDLGQAGYIAIFDVDPATNEITISASPVAQGGPYFQWNNGLPTNIGPGGVYTPQWTGSAQCNNTYDPLSHTYFVRYGYLGATGYRITEEIIAPQ